MKASQRQGANFSLRRKAQGSKAALTSLTGHKHHFDRAGHFRFTSTTSDMSPRRNNGRYVPTPDAR